MAAENAIGVLYFFALLPFFIAVLLFVAMLVFALLTSNGLSEETKAAGRRAARKKMAEDAKKNLNGDYYD